MTQHVDIEKLFLYFLIAKRRPYVERKISHAFITIHLPYQHRVFEWKKSCFFMYKIKKIMHLHRKMRMSVENCECVCMYNMNIMRVFHAASCTVCAVYMR